MGMATSFVEPAMSGGLPVAIGVSPPDPWRGRATW